MATYDISETAAARAKWTKFGGDDDDSFSGSGRIGADLSNGEKRDHSEGAIARPEQVTNTTANHLLFVAMLEQMCNLYQPDPNKARSLFQMLCTHLRKMNLMDGLRSLDELCTIRTQYKNSFIKLIQGCVTVLNKDNRPQTRPDRLQLIMHPQLSHSNPVIEVAAHFHTSRYIDEYEEIGPLGVGAYGAVTKVRYTLNDQIYAVKKIVFYGTNHEHWYKVIREVKYLACLSHPNVVRYYHAWVEHDFGEIVTNLSSTTGVNVSIPRAPRAIEYQKITHTESLHIEHNTEDVDEDYSDDNFIVFQSSNSASHKTVLHNECGQRSNSSRGYSGHIYTESSSTLSTTCVCVYIQMELCDSTLKEWINHRNNSPCEDGSFSVVNKEINMKILKQILKAMVHIHSENIIHRDLKPQNIFISNNSDNVDSSNMKVKIGDFGLSRNMGPSTPATPPLTPHPGMKNYDDSPEWTSFTSGVGTAIYAAPEQLSGSDYNQKNSNIKLTSRFLLPDINLILWLNWFQTGLYQSDMYSLGLIMFEMYQPFGTEMERRTCLNQLRTGEIPCNFKAAWPDESIYIEKLLNVNQNERPTANELLETELFISKGQVIKDLRETLQSKNDLIKEKDSEIAQLKENLRKKDCNLSQKEFEIQTLKLELLKLTQLNPKSVQS